MGFFKDFKDFKDFRADRRAAQEREEYYRDRPRAKQLSESSTNTSVMIHLDPTTMLVDQSGHSVVIHNDGNTTIFINRLDWPEIKMRVERVIQGSPGECETH